MARLDFLEVEEDPSTPRVCPDGAGDHSAWSWENKALLVALTRPWQVAFSKETPELNFKLPFPSPSLFSAQASFALTRFSFRDMGHCAPEGRPAGLSSDLLVVCPGCSGAPLFWEVAAEPSVGGSQELLPVFLIPDEVFKSSHS